MTTNPRPPRLALALLARFVPDQEALIGDLVEEFERRRSRAWFWRQAIAALFISWRSSRRHLTTVRLTNKPLPLRYEEVSVPIRLSASPFPIAGGLGIASLGAVVAIYRPGAWWLVLAGLAGGLVLGIIKVVITRKRFRADPAAYLTQHRIRLR
jgi:hypothetical protein